MTGADPLGPRCAALSRLAAEPMPGSAPRADVWVVVEHPGGWGDAPLARAEHGVRVLMARAATDRTAAEGFRVWVARCTDGTRELRLGVVADPADVGRWDLATVAAGWHRSWGRPDPDPLLLVCANGRRDRCCGHDGARLADLLWAGPRADRVLTCTHLGGHRFAPTALLLPSGAVHGRLDEPAAAALLAAAADGRTPSASLRGFSTLDEMGQVADVAARQATGYDRATALTVQVIEEHADRATAVVALPPPPGPVGPFAGNGPTGQRTQVKLASVGRPTVPSCGRTIEEQRRWIVAAVDT